MEVATQPLDSVPTVVSVKVATVGLSTASFFCATPSPVRLAVNVPVVLSE